jgi:hypothetical protein
MLAREIPLPLPRSEDSNESVAVGTVTDAEGE